MAEQLKWVGDVASNFKEEPQKLKDVLRIASYVQKHNLQEIFNKILTQLIHIRPPDAKEFILDQLKAIKAKKFEKEEFLTDKDFESIFETYDFLKLGEVTAPFLAQGKDCLTRGLEVVGVENAEEVMLKNHEVTMKDKVKKAKFISILRAEHKSRGYKYS